MMLKSAYSFLGIFLFCIFCQPLLSAQAERTINYYGWLNGKFPVTILLNGAGKTIEGLAYLASHDPIALKGKYNNESFTLSEFSADGKELGVWELQSTEQGNQGYFSLADFSQAIVWRQEEPQADYIFQKIESKVEREDWELILQSISAEKISGALYSSTKQQYFQLAGGWDEQRGISLQIIGAEKEIKGQLWLKSKQAESMVLQWNNEAAQMINISTTDFANKSPQIIHDKISQLYFLAPELNHSNFDQWLSGKLNPLWERAQAYGQKVSATKFHPGLRARVRAEAVCQINWLTEHFVSGQINYWDSWSAKELQETFVFDLEKGIALTQKDFLKNQTAFAGFVKDKILTKYKHEENPQLQEWLQQAAVDQWVLRPDGMWWATDFHPIFGQAGILLDEATMTPYMKSGKLLGK